MNRESGRVRTLEGHRQVQHGFTLIEMMITVVVLALIAAVAYPSYTRYVVRANRQAAQTELVQMANLQEKIYLNSNAYSASVTTAYDGTSAGGLGKTSGLTSDGKYTLTVSPTTSGQIFTLTATPVTTGTQANDGVISITSTGIKTWGTSTW
jgi:type IV pilus assembly protein PilE